MTQSDNCELQALEALLDEVRRTPKDVPHALTARVLMEADRLQPQARRPEKRNLSLDSFLNNIGGWPAFGGLAAASCMGFWIGISPPESFVDPVLLLLPMETETYYDPAELTGFGWDMQEG